MTIKQAKEADKLLAVLAKNKKVETMSPNALAEEAGLNADSASHYFHLLNYDELVGWDKNPFITGKGLLFLEEGGYTAKAKKEIVDRILILIAALASVVGVAIGIIAFFKDK